MFLTSSFLNQQFILVEVMKSQSLSIIMPTPLSLRVALPKDSTAKVIEQRVDSITFIIVVHYVDYCCTVYYSDARMQPSLQFVT